MPAVAFDRRDRSGALPTASSGTPSAGPEARGLTTAEETLLEHVGGHGDAEVICIVRPGRRAGADAGGAGEVFVLQSASRDFIDGLARLRAAAAPAPQGGGRAPVMTADQPAIDQRPLTR
jgi:hypothetical protein